MIVQELKVKESLTPYR